MADDSVWYYCDKTDNATFGLPHKDNTGIDINRDRTNEDKYEYWEKLCGLSCKCYIERKPSDYRILDKTRVTDVGDTFILDLTKSLTMVVEELNYVLTFPKGEYMHYIQCKIWPENLEDVVKIEYKKVCEENQNIKYFKLTGMVLKEASQNLTKGHYMAATRIDDKWFFCDDDTIVPLRLSGAKDHRKSCYPTTLIF